MQISRSPCRVVTRKSLASLTAERQIDVYSPRAIIIKGVAGALKGSLNIGDIVVGTSYMQHDVDARALGLPVGVPGVGHRFSKCRPRRGRTGALEGRVSQTIHKRSDSTWCQFFTEEQTLANENLFGEMNGIAIDMESAAVALVCFINDIRFCLENHLLNTTRKSRRSVQ